MGVELTLLACCRTGGDDTELAKPKSEARAGKDFAVAVGDHPCVKRGMKIAHVVAKQLV